MRLAPQAIFRFPADCLERVLVLVTSVPALRLFDPSVFETTVSRYPSRTSCRRSPSVARTLIHAAIVGRRRLAVRAVPVARELCSDEGAADQPASIMLTYSSMYT